MKPSPIELAIEFYSLAQLDQTISNGWSAPIVNLPTLSLLLFVEVFPSFPLGTRPVP